MINDELKCPECGGIAHFVQGATYLERLEQYHCDNCGYTFITNGYGKFIREGILSDPSPIMDFP